jgi:8-oxo-dGTP pyrophosphatase MutT (NUDIX family)/phosphohistidine phosphatase SixA
VPAPIAAGAVVWQRSPSGAVEIAVIHRPRYDDWSLPKGKPRAGELLPMTAVREVAEETGQGIILGPRMGTTHYPVPAGEKVVHYWLATATGGTFCPGDEVDDLRWLPVPKALDLLSHPHDQTLLNGIDGLIDITGTLLLVRHGDAGEREKWQGDDDLRPLTAAGRRQSKVLRTLLPRLGARRVHSAPPLRCQQTVEELAADLAVPIITEPLLSESGYQTDPDASLRRLLDIAAGPGGPAVVCSQGGVIPDLVGKLVDASDLGRLEVRTAKGSYWVLFFNNSSCASLALLRADYYDDAVG